MVNRGLVILKITNVENYFSNSYSNETNYQNPLPFSIE